MVSNKNQLLTSPGVDSEILISNTDYEQTPMFVKQGTAPNGATGSGGRMKDLDEYECFT